MGGRSRWTEGDWVRPRGTKARRACVSRGGRSRRTEGDWVSMGLIGCSRAGRSRESSGRSGSPWWGPRRSLACDYAYEGAGDCGSCEVFIRSAHRAGMKLRIRRGRCGCRRRARLERRSEAARGPAARSHRGGMRHSAPTRGSGAASRAADPVRTGPEDTASGKAVTSTRATGGTSCQAPSRSTRPLAQPPKESDLPAGN